MTVWGIGGRCAADGRCKKVTRRCVLTMRTDDVSRRCVVENYWLERKYKGQTVLAKVY